MQLNQDCNTKKPSKQGDLTQKLQENYNISRPTSVPLTEPCGCGYTEGSVSHVKHEIFAVRCGNCDLQKNLATFNDDQLEIIANFMPVGVGDE